MRRIAIANHKGGVGKTTTAVNLAAGLAQDGHRTLLVDVDAQAHATFWFAEDPDEIDYDLQDVITKGTPLDQVILRTRIENLDLLPSTLGLAPLETELVSMTRREDRIDRALAAVDDQYDYAVLDLAPSLSLLTLAALVAATDLIAPVSATKLAMGGLGAFLGWTDDFRTEGLITAPLARRADHDDRPPHPDHTRSRRSTAGKRPPAVRDHDPPPRRCGRPSGRPAGRRGPGCKRRPHRRLQRTGQRSPRSDARQQQWVRHSPRLRC